ncbi:MAG TPA: MOSC domain-containing protein [Thermomicrobiales bacterium]|nr:MOSC domain-containing protein [Thermomicrobiales bacterium]
MITSRNTITLRSVGVGKPALLGQRRGEEVLSGIRKQRVTLPTVDVTTTNIAGDGQADLRNHGGFDKAVYCYPSEHLSFWGGTIGYAGDGNFAPFGENLSISGIDEETACIGDIWRWGSVTLQISQPRWPCFKLDMHSGVKALMNQLIKSGRCGWYLRVLEEGVAPTSGEIEIAGRDPLGISVRQAFDARRDPSLDPQRYEEIMSHPGLAAAWKR